MLKYTYVSVFTFEALGDQIIFVTRPDKKKILFYNDKSCQFTVDEGWFSNYICKNVYV